MSPPKKVVRCVACAGRISDSQAHVGVLEIASGVEVSYHARCQERAALETASRMERGKVYILRHYHSSACPDAHPGPDCSGGCFSGVGVVAN